MGRIPSELRQIIAANIRTERIKKYPGRGGAKHCAETFGVSPQQWSPWERGMRTPDELRLSQIADFFGVTVDHMRRDHSVPQNKPDTVTQKPGALHYPEPSLHGLALADGEILCQLQKNFSGLVDESIRFHITVQIVLSKEAKQETRIRPK